MAIGVLGWLPLMVFVYRAIRGGDEFSRRMHLVALGFAFAATLLMISLCSWLSRAGFTEPVRLDLLWLGAALVWAVSIFASKWYFER